MRILDEEKDVDLNEKVTIEMTLLEIAYITAILGFDDHYDEDKIIDECPLIKKAKTELAYFDPFDMFCGLSNFLSDKHVWGDHLEAMD